MLANTMLYCAMHAVTTFSDSLFVLSALARISNQWPWKILQVRGAK